MLGVLVGSAVLLGVGIGAVAWADDGPPPDREARAAKKATVRDCVEQARAGSPEAGSPDEDRAALKGALAACIKEAGIELPGFPPEMRAKMQARKACLETARNAAGPDADKSAVREAAAACLEEAGVFLPKLPPELRAKAEAVRECLDGVKEANPDGERPALKEAAKPCLAQAGVDVGAAKQKMEKLRACMSEARAATADADRATLKPLVMECLKKG